MKIGDRVEVISHVDDGGIWGGCYRGFKGTIRSESIGYEWFVVFDEEFQGPGHLTYDFNSDELELEEVA
jgi:hypothetical protein